MSAMYVGDVFSARIKGWLKLKGILRMYFMKEAWWFVTGCVQRVGLGSLNFLLGLCGT